MAGNYVALHCSTCMYGSKVRVKAWVERLKRPPTENAKILMTQKEEVFSNGARLLNFRLKILVIKLSAVWIVS